MEQSDYGKIIKKLRKERKWTQKQLADCLSVCRATIQNWEYGTAAPNKSSLYLLIEKLELTRENCPELFALLNNTKSKGESPNEDFADTAESPSSFSLQQKISANFETAYPDHNTPFNKTLAYPTEDENNRSAPKKEPLPFFLRPIFLIGFFGFIVWIGLIVFAFIS